MTDETALASNRWGYPFQIGIAASWRLVLTMSVIVVIPVGAVSLLFFVVGLPVVVPVFILTAALWFVLSYGVHELGHSLALWVVAGRLRRPREMVANGTYFRASILRWSLGAHGDALVSIAGPIAAVVAGLPLLLPFWPFVMSFPFFCLFLVHLASLAPRFSDGAQVFASLTDRFAHAHRD